MRLHRQKQIPCPCKVSVLPTASEGEAGQTSGASGVFSAPSRQTAGQSSEGPGLGWEGKHCFAAPQGSLHRSLFSYGFWDLAKPVIPDSSWTHQHHCSGLPRHSMPYPLVLVDKDLLHQQSSP